MLARGWISICYMYILCTIKDDPSHYHTVTLIILLVSNQQANIVLSLQYNYVIHTNLAAEKRIIV